MKTGKPVFITPGRGPAVGSQVHKVFLLFFVVCVHMFNTLRINPYRCQLGQGRGVDLIDYREGWEQASFRGRDIPQRAVRPTKCVPTLIH